LAWIGEISPGDAEGQLASLYERMAEPDGSVDHILRVHGVHPASLEAHYELYVRAMKGPSPLTRRRREMIAVVVSALNECHY
jgi:alkylhydroperoxidase family enzyme